MSLGRMLVCIAVTSLLLCQIYSAEALTRSEKDQQITQREQALEQARQAKATNTTNRISSVITLEISCEPSGKCPSFAELVPYDTTNQKYVGKLTDEKRLKSPVKNPGVIYKNNKDLVICLDCPWAVYKNSRHIIIDTLTVYKLDSDRKYINNTRHEYHNRYVENCNTATIAWLPGLLEDTINYLKSGCTQTDFNEKLTIKKDYVKHDLTTSPAYKYQKWLADSKKLKTENCLKSDRC